MADIDPTTIKWRTVTVAEYNDAVITVPHRKAWIGGDEPVYELGTIPPAVPIKQGAIVKPSPEWIKAEEERGSTWEDDTFFVFDGTDWHYASQVEGFDTLTWGSNDHGAADVRKVLVGGGTIVFEGWDN